ncbi:putative Zein-binding domain-containing protein [Medicago truncatula]|uniref:Putative Zein-binding domain-containing protein n=1 Tax=Medicago truncatula TaxID=3880 RepID=G7JFI7_MEDTR|nr:myosin-binding protein 7 [Medicago truncatula]XP_024636832.1 myosin-binding protein 7 [Medicago truncatula]XP_039689906.1 myosin-binding protein 7 [Medicago truncatula]AES92470.1 zein-binding protein [Medicago truncatula]RHN64860.1 putative Zein-binding domain-containing protein [Medicago truncatula]
MSESDITAMKETLRAQQQLLQKLYAELDQEREASATAASEAMDMILRLQGEKAAVKMEASHYKRMSEEKIGHAEATLEVFEELMYQKEMEIASLEFQVCAYKHKLLTLGADFNASEFEFPEDHILNRNDQQHNGENVQSSTIKRLSSLPPIPSKNRDRANRKRDRSPTPIPVSDVIPNTLEDRDREVISPSLELPRKSMDLTYGTLDSYWNQIQSLDEKVNEISDCKESGVEKCANLRSRRGRSCSIFSQESNKIPLDKSYRLPYPINADKENHFERGMDTPQVSSPSCSVNVHDVFEVPQTSEKHEVSEHGKRRLERWISDVDNRLIKPDSMSEEIIEAHVKHDMEKLKSIMLSTNHEVKKSNHKGAKSAVDCNVEAEFHKLHQRIDRLERERVSIRQDEIRHEGNGEEYLRLLKDIQSQLNSIQSEMRNCNKTKKASPKKEDVSLGPLQEAMLYFWL